jgi:hypothetical protein
MDNQIEPKAKNVEYGSQNVPTPNELRMKPPEVVSLYLGTRPVEEVIYEYIYNEGSPEDIDRVLEIIVNSRKNRFDRDFFFLIMGLVLIIATLPFLILERTDHQMSEYIAMLDFLMTAFAAVSVCFSGSWRRVLFGDPVSHLRPRK